MESHPNGTRSVLVVDGDLRLGLLFYSVRDKIRVGVKVRVSGTSSFSSRSPLSG